MTLATRPDYLRLKPMLLICAIVLALAAGCVLWVDIPVAQYMRSLDPQTRALAEPVTMLGKAEWPLIALAVLTVFFAARRQWGRANRTVFIFLSISATLVVHLLKIGLGRARPKLYFSDDRVYGFSLFKFIEQGGGYYDYASFPSGHSAVAGALAMAVWLVSPAWLKWPIAVLSVLIVASRVVLTSHWVADTLAGFLLGVICAAVLHWRFSKRGWLDNPSGFLWMSKRGGGLA